MSSPEATFINEAHEHLEIMEQAFLELESDFSNAALIDEAFRAMHTIKGSGGMFGFQVLSEFTHHLETALDLVRNNQLSLSRELITVMLDSKDIIEDMLEMPEPDAELRLRSKALLDRLHEILPLPGAPVRKIVTDDTAEDTGKSAWYRVRFKPHAETFRDGFDVRPVIRELAGLGECHVTTITDALPEPEDFSPEHCYLSWDVLLETDRGQSEIEDVFMFVEDDWHIEITEIDLLDDDEESSRLGELLVERGLVSKDQVKQVMASNQPIGSLLAQNELVGDDEVQAALSEQKQVRSAARKDKAGSDALIRVPASRLDRLMNLVGELVIVQARMNQIAHNYDDEHIVGVSEELDRLTTEMRDQTFSIRMVPIGTTFGRFRRLVRDLSQELEKEIVLETEGGETELDKMVIDRLADPLVHIIRNSVDHGIESPEVRLGAGKREQGTVRLSARHAQSQVIIQIEDDGQGLNQSKILAKAEARGLVPQDTDLADEDIYQLIMEPGFSTAEAVSDISGRGVGMDVVKRSIQDLGGRVAISSQEGRGMVITISLPMTLAIIEGLMVRVADEHYVLPFSSVEECIEMPRGKDSLNRQRQVKVRGELVPYLNLRECFALSGDQPAIEQVVITRQENERFGFCVDDVIGQYQTVVKRLGKLYEGVEGFSGATIMGDGSVAMILDPVALMNESQSSTDTSHLSG